ncbi:hypothetical protein JW890_02670 [candidate division WOR-3 bacterium]|nr:hypothetical protein [candidate division WOR-3 bacterium]
MIGSAYPRHRMFKTTAWQNWALGWRFVFFCYFFATAAFFLGLGLSPIWFAVLIPPAVFYHFLGSSLWKAKQWTKKAAITEHFTAGTGEIIFVILLFLMSPKTAAWKDFSFLTAKICIFDLLLRISTLIYLYKNPNFPGNSVKKP